MSAVSKATESLRLALHSQGVERHIQDAFSHLASCLVLLNSSSPSVQMINRLRSVLRQPLLPLYDACLQPTLQLSASLLSTVLDRLSDAHINSEGKLREVWDATAEVILSGVLDFLEQKDDGHADSEATAWERLCRIICDFFFTDSSQGLPTPSVSLSLSAFNALTEIAIRQPTIQTALRDKAVLGGQRLGAAISRTKDYLLTEALLTLFARLLPPIHNTSQGKSKRIKFVKDVLGSPKLFKCSAELVDIMQKTSVTLWDDVAAQIIDALARSDITYPQPFPIDEIDVCGRVFLQPLATDRLIMDKQTFLVNVVTENDDPCESLQVPYTHIRTVTIDSSRGALPIEKALITLDLTSPPLVANNEMKSVSGSLLYAQFLVPNDTMSRFMEALRRRGVGKLKFVNSPTKTVKQSKRISLGSGVKFGDKVSSLTHTSSFEDKVQLVNQVYDTNIHDSTTFEGLPALPLRHKRSAPPSDSEAVTKPATPRQAKPTIPLQSDLSKPIKVPPLQHLGELRTVTESLTDKDSDISEFEPEIVTSKKCGTTSVSASFNPDSKAMQCITMQIDLSDRKSKESAPRSEKSQEFTSKPEASAWKPTENEKTLIPSDSPEINWSSSTRVDLSPHPSSEATSRLPAVAVDVFANQPPVSRDVPVICTDPTEPLSIKDTALRDEKAPIESTIKASTEFIPTYNDLAAPEESPPPKIAGGRRKRDTKLIQVEAEECGPPNKKIRKARMEDNDRSEERSVPTAPVPNTAVPRTKKHVGKKAVRPSSTMDPPIDGLDELLENTKPSGRGTRRSERIKGKRPAATSGTQNQITRSKTRKGKQSSPVDVKQSGGVFVPDSSVIVSPGAGAVHSSTPISPPMPIKPLHAGAATHDYRAQGKAKGAENITLVNHAAREISQASGIRPHELIHLSAESSKAPWEDFVRHAVSVSNVAQTQGKEGFQIEAGESTNDNHLTSDLSPIESHANQLEHVIEYSVSLKGSEDSSEPPRPMESTPRKEVVTIDLTLDNSPIQQKRDLRKASVVSERSDARVSSDQPECTPTRRAVDELQTIAPSHQNKSRSVTFASPIHDILDNDLASEPRVNTSKPGTETPSKGFRTSTGRSPFSDSDVLSPLSVPTAPMNFKHGPFDQAFSWATLQKPKSSLGNKRPTYIVPHNPSPPKTISHTKTASASGSDEVDIQDIVDVLNDIQAAVVKGVSNRFEKVKKDIRIGRDELIQQVLDELQRLATDNVKHFNGLVALEEAYHENGKAITHCWEDLIDCNESILVLFRNTLKEQDQEAQMLLPKSLSALKPVFTRGRLNV